MFYLGISVKMIARLGLLGTTISFLDNNHVRFFFCQNDACCTGVRCFIYFHMFYLFFCSKVKKRKKCEMHHSM